ncbi:hypothetical protein C8Q79DRAFT_964483 [Trametes meyenii]|nr:hypothetical protein C8Q79DRAFT_964483 [Trametes meyenii]
MLLSFFGAFSPAGAWHILPLGSSDVNVRSRAKNSPGTSTRTTSSKPSRFEGFSSCVAGEPSPTSVRESHSCVYMGARVVLP